MTGDRTPALAVRDLRVARGHREVLRVDQLDIHEGETVAILGPNGAGKSTLLLAAALLLPVEGEVTLFGETAGRRNTVRLRRMTATVFQEPALLDMTARRNVEKALALHGIPRTERPARAELWLTRLGVAHRADARAHQLSGGEGQRISLARALACQPRLLYLDEPFSGLDATTRWRLVGEIRSLLQETGVTALLTTHDHAEAALLADKVVVLLNGRVAQTGLTADVLRHPATVDVARFLGFTIVDGAAGQSLGLEGPGAAAVPPDAVHLTPSSCGPAIATRVVAVEGGAGGARLVVEAGPGLAANVTLDELHQARWQPGDAVTIIIDRDRVTRL